jgi:hypothetical protein
MTENDRGFAVASDDRLDDLIRRFLLRRMVRQSREHAAVLIAAMI